MALLYVYFALAASVAIMAMIRGRPALVWFLVAVFATPLIAGLLVMALPKLQPAPAMSDESGSVFSPRRVPMPENSAIRIVRPVAIGNFDGTLLVMLTGSVVVQVPAVGTVDRDRAVDFRVPSGQVSVQARDDWGESSPLMIETTPNTLVEIEVAKRPLQPILAIAFGNHLTLRRLPGDRAI